MNFPITNNKYLTIHEALILHSGILAFILSSSIQENNLNKENQLLSILLGIFILKDTRSVKILTAFLCILAKFMVCIHHSHKQLVISAVVLFSHHDVQMLCFCTVSNQHNHGAMTTRVMNTYPFCLIKVEQFFYVQMSYVNLDTSRNNCLKRVSSEATLGQKSLLRPSAIGDMQLARRQPVMLPFQ
jgi:hypothetical protein